MTRNGKIARLPLAIREELNRRLQDGVTGKAVVAWLNDHADVKALLQREFNERPVTEQNLSEWKQGGYQDWLQQQEVRECVRTFQEGLGNVTGSSGTRLGDDLSTPMALLLGRMTFQLIAGGLDKAAQRREVFRLVESLALLRRGDHEAARLRMAQERHQDQRLRDEARWQWQGPIEELVAERKLRGEFERKVEEPLNDLMQAVRQERRLSELTKGLPLDIANQIREYCHASPLKPAPPSTTESNPIRPDPTCSEAACSERGQR